MQSKVTGSFPVLRRKMDGIRADREVSAKISAKTLAFADFLCYHLIFDS